jgi:prevent-host-death family protein
MRSVSLAGSDAGALSRRATMGHAQIKHLTSREFAHNVSAASRVVLDEGGTVIVTNRGEETMALVPIAEYRRMTKTDQNLVELLRMSGSGVDDIDIEPVHLDARDV